MARGVRIDRLFYELGAEISDFEKGMANAEKSATKFTNYVKKHPIAAVGALTAAFVALAAQATRMAAAIETNMRKVGAAMPAAAGRMKELTREVLELSKTTPRTAQDLSAALIGVAKQTDSPIEAMARLRASVVAADAAGADLGVVIEGLDNVLDAFGISGAQSEVVLAKLFATAKGKVSLDELFFVLQRNGAELKRMGFGLDEAAAHMVKLLDAGVPGRQVMTQFKATVKEVAGTTIEASTALRELHASAQFSREGTEALWQVLKNNLNAELITLGTQILPLVNKGFEVMVGFLMHMNGALRDIKADSAVRALEALGKTLDNATDEQRVRDLKRIQEAINDITHSRVINAGLLKNLSDEEFKALRAGLTMQMRYAEAAGISALHVKRIVEALQMMSRISAQERPGTLPGAVTPQPSGMPRPTARPLIDEATQRRRDAMVEEARDAIAKLSGSLSVVFNREMDKIAARARELFGTDLPAEVRQWMDALRAEFDTSQVAAGFEEDFQALTEESERGAEALRGGYAGAIAEATTKLRGLQGLVQDELDLSQLSVAERERLLKLLGEIEKQLHANAAAAGKSVKAAKDENKEREKAIAKANELGRRLENAARGALDLANAFGLMDDNTARVLENVVQIGAAMPAALAGDWTAIGSVLGGFAQVVRGLFGGTDSQSAEQKRLLEQALEFQRKQDETLLRLRSTIAELTRTVGELGTVDAPGAEFAGTKGEVERLLNFLDSIRLIPPGTPGVPNPASLFNLPELTDALRRLGIDVDLTTANIDQVRAALEALNAIELTQFVETFAGQLEALRVEFELFDIADPIAQLQKLVQLFNDPNFGAPALRQALAGLDLTTPEGRAAAKTAIQALFQQLQAGTLAPAMLGGLTGQQFLEQLLQINQLLKSGTLADGSAVGQTRPFGVEQKITDVQADRLIALETTGNAYLQAQLAVQEAMLAHLRAILPPLVNLQPPSLSALSAMPAGGISIGDIHITIQTSATDPAGIRDAITDGLVEAIAKKLETVTRQRSHARGSVMLS